MRAVVARGEHPVLHHRLRPRRWPDIEGRRVPVRPRDHAAPALQALRERVVRSLPAYETVGDGPGPPVVALDQLRVGRLVETATRPCVDPALDEAHRSAPRAAPLAVVGQFARYQVAVARRPDIGDRDVLTRLA